MHGDGGVKSWLGDFGDSHHLAATALIIHTHPTTRCLAFGFGPGTVAVVWI